MARYEFGGGAADVVERNGRPAAGIVVTFWTAKTGGTQVTDLLDSDNVAITSVTSDSLGQLPPFQGPDGVTELWAQAAGSSVRVRLDTYSWDEVASSASASATAAAASAATAATSAANAVQRANHTGVQAISTVTGLQTALDAKLASADASATYVARADAASGSDDLTALQARVDALVAAGGGTLLLRAGTYKLSGALALPQDGRVKIEGEGERGTTLTFATGYTGTLLTLGDKCGLDNLRIILNTTLTGHGITVTTNPTLSDATYRTGTTLRNLRITGGGGTTYAAIYATDFFRSTFEAVVMDVGCNGWKLAVTHNDYNYGNSVFVECEVSLATGNTIGWDITYTATRNVNLISFLYCSAVTGVAGTTGIRVQNGAYLTFVGIDIEGCATALDLQGGLTSGATSYGLTFINPYCGTGGGAGAAAITIGTNAPSVTFVGGRLFGTITDSNTTAGRLTQYLGTVDGTGAQIIGKTQHHKAGPRFSDGAYCITGRVSGGPFVRGTLVRLSNQYAIQQTSVGTSQTRWLGALIADATSTVDADIAVAGTAPVLSTNAVTYGDHMVLDPSTAGSAKSIGTAFPPDRSLFVGIAMETIASAGVVRVKLAEYRPDRRPITTYTANTALSQATDLVVLSNGSGLTQTLPTAANAGTGREYVVKNLHATAATVAVSSAGTIDGAASVSLAQYEVLRVISDGTTWHRL